VATSEFSIATDHPALAGHFPGNPVVPGALVLDEVINAFASSGGTSPSAIVTAKFLHPLLPGQRCIVEFSPQPEGRVQFVCRSQDQIIASGQLLVGAP
jgi:3-hydroxyacyl-[acyl-carrier-protein] dehydratase